MIEIKTVKNNKKLQKTTKNCKKLQKTTKNCKKHKKMSALDKYLVFCFGVLLIYTIVHSYIFYVSGQEASTLSVLVFGVFGTSEPIICGLIKLFKLKTEKKDPEETQEEGSQG